MIRHALKILQHLLQDFCVSDHFMTLQSKGLIKIDPLIIEIYKMNS